MIEIKTLNDKYKLKKPFEVTKTVCGSEIIYEIKELNVYAFSEDLDEAIEEIAENLIWMYHELLPLDNSEMGKRPRQWKVILLKHLKMEGVKDE